MSDNKKIPCRVCGTLFTPCAYCQSHDGVFRWRNFACSRTCAADYIKKTMNYRTKGDSSHETEPENKI